MDHQAFFARSNALTIRRFAEAAVRLPLTRLEDAAARLNQLEAERSAVRHLLNASQTLRAEATDLRVYLECLTALALHDRKADGSASVTSEWITDILHPVIEALLICHVVGADPQRMQAYAALTGVFPEFLPAQPIVTTM